MNYKNMLFCALLVPLSLFSNTCPTNKAWPVQEHNEVDQKLSMISVMGKKIAEQDEYIRSLRSSAVDFLLTIIKKKGLNAQEAQEFGKTIDDELDNFKKAFDEAILTNKNIKGFLVKELFNPQKDIEFDDFETVKFCVIRLIIEHRILKNLIKQYEDLQQELLEIDQQLDLQK